MRGSVLWSADDVHTTLAPKPAEPRAWRGHRSPEWQLAARLGRDAAPRCASPRKRNPGVALLLCRLMKGVVAERRPGDSCCSSTRPCEVRTFHPGEQRRRAMLGERHAIEGSKRPDMPRDRSTGPKGSEQRS